jgi:hypothetical protein
MKLALIIVVLLVIFIILPKDYRIDEFNVSSKQVTQIESFNNGHSFIGSSPPNLISNSRSNDYYMDRTGRNGILHNQLSNHRIYQEPINQKRKNNYNQTIKRLEIYPEDTYTKCVSKYNPDKIVDDVIKNDPMNTYLQFNQGLLIRSKCYTTKSDC